MSGVTFRLYESGHKTAAVIDLRRYAHLWEDLYDTWLADSRAHEPRESLGVSQSTPAPKGQRTWVIIPSPWRARRDQA